MKLAIRVVLGAFALVALLVAIYLSYAALGLRAHARTHGTLRGLALRAPVEIVRDGRGVPHIVADNLHDLFFAQGYVEGSDRLFQMDLLRRYVTGHLAEILGKPALASDEAERAVPVAAIVARQWRRLGPHERAILRAFSAGVNAAIAREPLPVEFRILGYRPALWTPRDSMAVAMATVLDLIDDWNAVADRDRAYRHGGAAALARRFPLSDPCYDAPLSRTSLPARTAGSRPRSTRSSPTPNLRSAATSGRSGPSGRSRTAPCWPTTRIWGCTFRGCGT